MNQLTELINDLESKIPQFEQTNTAVSAVSVGWHIVHSLMAINKMSDSLRHSDPNEYQWKFNLTRILVQTMGKIPRGKGKAPESVLPAENFNIQAMKDLAEKSREKIMGLENLNSRNYLDHPVFGKLKLKHAIKAIYIHTKHHIGIINDIIKKNK